MKTNTVELSSDHVRKVCEAETDFLYTRNRMAHFDY